MNRYASVLCIVFCVLRIVSRKEPQYDPKSSKNRPRINKKGVENIVLRGIGAPWEVPWGHFGPRGPKVSAGIRNCFKNHVFYGCEFIKLAFCSGVVRKRPAKVSYSPPDQGLKRDRKRCKNQFSFYFCS